MRIVIAVDVFDPSAGYLEYYLADKLKKLGHTVCVLTFGTARCVERVTLEEGFEVIRLPYFVVANYHRVPTFGALTYLTRFLRSERPHIVHLQPIYSWLALVLLSCETIFNFVSVGSIMTGMPTLPSTWTFKRKMWFCVSKVLVKHFSEKRVNVIFAINKELMELIIRSYDVSPDKFRIIPLGADPTLFKFRPHARTSIRKKLGFSSKDVVIVYSGKIYPSKGLDLLLEAAHPIISQNRHLKLLVVGKFTQPEYEKEIHSLISHLDLSHNITFLPWVHRTKLADFYSASDIAVWPGASSISIIEAASVGLPIVIADYPLEIHAIAYGNGFTFRIGDIAGLRKCLGLLASNGKLRRQMGHKSRLIVKEKLNWQIISKQYFDTYLTTLKGSQSPIKEHLADARPRRYELLVIS